MNKKALGPVVATSLLIIVAVVSLIGFQSWYGGYQSKTTSNVEIKTNTNAKEVSIEYISGSILYIKNTIEDNYTYSKIQVGNKECNLNENLSLGINQINISSCLGNLTTGVNDLIIITPNGIIEEKLFLDEENVVLETPIIAQYSSVYQETILNDTPLSYWRLGERSGTTAIDLMGNYDGTYISSPTLNLSSGIVNDINGSVNFSSGDYISVPSFNIGNSTGLSVEGWIKTSIGGGNTLNQNWNGPWGSNAGDIFYFQFMYPSAGSCGGQYLQYAPVFVIAGGSTPRLRAGSVGSEINDNQWHHIVGVFEGGSRLDIYVDGVKYNGVLHRNSCIGTSIPATINVITKDLTIGTANQNLDEIAIYSYALTDAQVLNHYNVGKGLN